MARGRLAVRCGSNRAARPVSPAERHDAAARPPRRHRPRSPCAGTRPCSAAAGAAAPRTTCCPPPACSSTRGSTGPSRSKGRGASSSTTGASSAGRPARPRPSSRISSPAWSGATPRRPPGGASARPSSRPTPSPRSSSSSAWWSIARPAGCARRVRYKAFEILDVGAREAAATRVRDAVARPAHAPESAVALALLLRSTDMLRRVAGATSARNERALEARRATLPPVVAAVLEALDARRRRLDAVGT